jgi:hypothetical protein
MIELTTHVRLVYECGSLDKSELTAPTFLQLVCLPERTADSAT